MLSDSVCKEAYLKKKRIVKSVVRVIVDNLYLFELIEFRMVNESKKNSHTDNKRRKKNQIRRYSRVACFGSIYYVSQLYMCTHVKSGPINVLDDDTVSSQLKRKDKPVVNVCLSEFRIIYYICSA